MLIIDQLEIGNRTYFMSLQVRQKKNTLNTAGIGTRSAAFFMHKTQKKTGDERHLPKAGVVKVSSKCRQNPKIDGLQKSQKGKMP